MIPWLRFLFRIALVVIHAVSVHLADDTRRQHPLHVEPPSTVADAEAQLDGTAANAKYLSDLLIGASQESQTKHILLNVSNIDTHVDYHRSSQIFSTLEALQKTCVKSMVTRWVEDPEEKGRLFVVEVGEAIANKSILVTSNAHGREMITAEVVLRFLQKVCSSQQLEEEVNSSHGLQTSFFNGSLHPDVRYVIVPIVNVMARETVENAMETDNDLEDELCLSFTHKKEGYLNVNLDYSVDWGEGELDDHLPVTGEETGLGSGPFSTYQARIVRDLAHSIQPVAFIDIHAGDRSFLTPYSFRERANEDHVDQNRMLEIIQADHCSDCPIKEASSCATPLATEQGRCDRPAGTSIDYMYAKAGIKYSSAWEVFLGPQNASSCCEHFNPNDGPDYNKVVEDWSGALFTAARYLGDKVDWHETTHSSEQLSGNRTTTGFSAAPNSSLWLQRSNKT